MIMRREFYLQPKCTLCNAYTLSEHFWVSRLSVKLQLIWIALWPFVILNVKMIKDQLKFNGCKCFPELTVINQCELKQGCFFFNKYNIFTSTVSGRKKPPLFWFILFITLCSERYFHYIAWLILCVNSAPGRALLRCIPMQTWAPYLSEFARRCSTSRSFGTEWANITSGLTSTTLWMI